MTAWEEHHGNDLAIVDRQRMMLNKGLGHVRIDDTPGADPAAIRIRLTVYSIWSKHLPRPGKVRVVLCRKVYLGSWD